MIDLNLMQYLICILGALIAIFVCLIAIRYELRSIWQNGIQTSSETIVSEADIKKIARLVIQEIKNSGFIIQETNNRTENDTH